ncbi:YjeF-related protein [Croceitalea dokdonensis DOKDO 023]|uniref:Bifunctional NAD(P)H-hydrate repair enzyme n=1 Tax=Croceitalea dokdonensis DOKDO 023 TaxID=1300341 RepID=A0A0P7AW69_9FLAO|nr:bifunctional ADP-dependent NAD(P)H-hydrate dehydratase/NAD(P)H-hydrate epimerase [Croceitalea dokdonensis]KPM30585.1 YjeF-related protein [Croceitalea dokdonensis DOKDO 023]
MKIFSAQQIYDADNFTITKQDISSDILMERSALRIFEWMHQRLQGAQVKIHLFCGIGNNGGDGIALARYLQENGYDIKVYVVNYSEKRSKDFLINLDRLKDRKLWPEFLDGNHDAPKVQREDIVVDAIFGIGLNRPPAPWVGELIGHLNVSGAFTLAVDIPSGMFMERIPENPEHVIRANYVLSFQAPKIPFFLPQTGIYVNQWELLDIGLDAEYLLTTQTAFEFIGKPEVLPMYIPRLKFTHKGTYGHVLAIGGSKGKIGAIRLASEAALTTGAGRVTAQIPKCGYLPLQTSVPEVMVEADDQEDFLTNFFVSDSHSVVCLGMGMGQEDKTVSAFNRFIKQYTGPLVIDADGLNILAKHPELKGHLPKDAILTPHPKELKRLLGDWKDDFEKLELVKAFSIKYKCIVILKGAHTIVVQGGKGFINSTGNPGMATAGTGDVLAGMVASFLAQGYGPLQASIFAVYLHGLAGDLAIAENGYEAMTASKLIDFIGKSFLELFKRPEPAPEEQQQQP